jgi:hypothetical protein
MKPFIVIIIIIQNMLLYHYRSHHNYHHISSYHPISHYIHRERFSKELEQAIHGTVRASPDEWGETLEGEQLRGGSFLEQDQIQVGDGDGVMCCVMFIC